MVRWFNGRLLDESSAHHQLFVKQRGGDALSALMPEDGSSDDDLSVDEAGLTFGASVFTTLRVYGGSLDHPLTQWQAHCDRLAASVRFFEWAAPDWGALRKGCDRLKMNYPVLRIALFPDGREWIVGRSLPKNLSQKAENGVTAWLSPPIYARSLPAHKTGNYLACWLARTQAQSRGAQEAILTNRQGDWLETATGNLWGWDGKQWWTPSNDRCLSGIMSAYLRKILAAAGQPVSLQSWPCNQPLQFEAIAYSNCVVGLVPIHTILSGDTRLEFNPKHERIKALQSQIRPPTQSDRDKHSRS